MSIDPPPQQVQSYPCSNCGAYVPRGQSYCANCGYGKAPPKSNSTAQALWLILFILIGLPSACVGSCFLMIATGSGGHPDPAMAMIAVGAFVLFGGLLYLMINAFRNKR